VVGEEEGTVEHRGSKWEVGVRKNEEKKRREKKKEKKRGEDCKGESKLDDRWMVAVI